MTPHVSAIIPTYNYGRFVRDAVDSVLAQTYSSLEVIVVDDGSKDDTCEVMAAYADNPRVRYIHQENRGLPGARNTGIRQAQGELIALLDADDVWQPDKLVRQLECFAQHPNAALLATGSYEMDVAGKRLVETDINPKAPTVEEFQLRDLIEFSAYRPSSVLMPKQLCEAVGFFDEQMRYVEDLDMWARMSRHGSILKINQALTGFRVHGAVQSMHTELNLRYHKLVLNKLFATIPELQQHQRWRRLAEARMYVHVSWMRHSAGDRWGALADILRSARSCQPLRSGKGQDLRWQRVKLLTHYLTHKAGS